MVNIQRSLNLNENTLEIKQATESNYLFYLYVDTQNEKLSY